MSRRSNAGCNGSGAAGDPEGGAQHCGSRDEGPPGGGRLSGPLYLQQHGYRIVPVNPKLREVLHERAYGSLAEVSLPVDLVDVFRASEHLPAHVDEILAMRPRPSVVWFQLGIRNEASAAKLEAAGIRVVQDRCIMVDHRRLVPERTSQDA